MARRRMLHRSIAFSKQLNECSEFEQLLFIRIIPFLDDFGKTNGDPYIVKMEIIPASDRTLVDIEIALNNLDTKELIIWYEVDGKKYICYPTFDKYQTGLHKRTNSEFPDPPNIRTSEKITEIQGISPLIEQNSTEQNTKELNSEQKIKELNVASVNKSDEYIHPNDYPLNNPEEVAAHYSWKMIEPNSVSAFYTTYLNAYRKGLPATKFYEFTSEILQDQSIKNKGAVFNKKVKEFLNK